MLKKRSERLEFVPRSATILEYGEHRRRKIVARSSLFSIDLETFHPGAQVQLMRPCVTRLHMQMPVILRDVIGV